MVYGPCLSDKRINHCHFIYQRLRTTSQSKDCREFTYLSDTMEKSHLILFCYGQHEQSHWVHLSLIKSSTKKLKPWSEVIIGQHNELIMSYVLLMCVLATRLKVKDIECIQKSIHSTSFFPHYIRATLPIKSRDHITPILTDQHWLPVSFRKI